MKISGSGTPQFSIGIKRGGFGIELQVDTDALNNLQKSLAGAPQRLKAAYVRAVNETNSVVAEETINLLTSAVNADREEIAARVTVTKATEGNLTKASVVIRSTPRLSMRTFRPEQRKEGVYVQPMRRSGGFVMRGAFGPDIRRLGRGVWRRKGKERLPIGKHPGIALSKLVRRARVLPQIEVIARVTLNRLMRKNLVIYALQTETIGQFGFNRDL